jgi:hypothetical protein
MAQTQTKTLIPEEMIGIVRPELLEEIERTEAAQKECQDWLDKNLLTIDLDVASRMQVETNRKILINKKLDELEAQYRKLFEDARQFWSNHHKADIASNGLKVLRKSLKTLEELKGIKNPPASLASLLYDVQDNIKNRTSVIKMYELFNSESIFKDLLPKVSES